MLMVKNEPVTQLVDKCLSCSQTGGLFSSSFIADKGTVFLQVKPVQETLTAVFSLEKSLNKKINLATRTWAFIILWQRCMSRTGTMHIKVIIICHVRHGVRELFGKIIPRRAKCHRKWTALQESRSKWVCHSWHNEGPVLLHFQGVLSASRKNTVLASKSGVSLDIPHV